MFSDEAADADPTTAVPATAATPPIPPADGPSASDGGDDDGNSKKKIIGAIVAVIALAAAAFAFFALTADDEAAAGEVVLEAVGDAGPAPFTDPVAAVDSKVLKWAEEGPPANVAPATSAGPEGYQATDGNVPGVFGGSLSEGSCERDQLVSFLTSNEAKASAWAGVLDIDAADIGGFVAGLTPINTSTDVRVVTHGFADDEVVPREAVLQRGTAVLADAQGIPRVNCYSGNPLTAASVNADEEFSGDPWPAFQQTNVVIINQAPADLSEFELIELTTGELFKRPVGTAGESDKVDGPPTEDVPNDGPIEFDTLIEDTLTESRTEAIYTMDVPDSAILTLTAANQRESIGSVRFLLTKSGDRFSDSQPRAGSRRLRRDRHQRRRGRSVRAVGHRRPSGLLVHRRSRVAERRRLGQGRRGRSRGFTDDRPGVVLGRDRRHRHRRRVRGRPRPRLERLLLVGERARVRRDGPDDRQPRR